MTSMNQPRAPMSGSQPPARGPKLGGDELFVPASHVLVIDREVSHPAFRLWCVLHRLWFLHEPPTMDLLQELMGTTVAEKHESPSNGVSARRWQPATRRSIERWLKELESAGWLIWVRREETTRRYHLRTSARSANDTAVLAELRSMLNGKKATLADVQALLKSAPDVPDDTTGESHASTKGSHQHALIDGEPPQDATGESHDQVNPGNDTTVASHHTTRRSHDATAESQDTTQRSDGTTAESHDAKLPSHEWRAEGVLVGQNGVPYSEILQNKISEDPTPPPAAATAPGGDGGGPTVTERYLLRQGFSPRAAREFRVLDLTAVQTDLERRRGLDQGIGAIVATWRVEPPYPAAAEPPEPPLFARRAANAKTQALAIAPPNASPLEIQYLALDLEEGVPHEAALASFVARRVNALLEGVV